VTLLHDAHADLGDKPHEMLAQENGKEGTAEMLKEWLGIKNRDWREREGDMGSGGKTEQDELRGGSRLPGGYRPVNAVVD